MSVLIRGIKMPVIDLEWTIRRGADGKWYAIDTNAETSDGEWHEIVPVPPHGGWIPVTERLPEDNEAVNVVWVNHNPVFYYQHIKDKPQTSTGVYYRGQWYWWSVVVQDYLAEYGKWEPDLMDSAIEVTHWMPLTEPPKEET